jgi:hypothetical protein
VRFFPIFGEKIGVFLMINFFQNLALFRVKNANFLAKFFGENILKIITSAPGHTGFASNESVSIHFHFPPKDIHSPCVEHLLQFTVPRINAVELLTTAKEIFYVGKLQHINFYSSM